MPSYICTQFTDWVNGFKPYIWDESNVLKYVIKQHYQPQIRNYSLAIL